VTRGEIWLAQVGRKSRPVLVVTRPEVIDVRLLVTVAEITTSIRGHAAEVPFDHAAVGLERESVVNCDGVHTVAQSSLRSHVATLDAAVMERVCGALTYALGC
jgi:mRNA-degrading endonuclease toxin of MazEF toxin-antitoxin module